MDPASSNEPVVPDPQECLYISPTTRCGLRCVFCANSKRGMRQQVMTADLFATVVEKACRFGYDAFNLTPIVGEPLEDRGLTRKLEVLEGHSGVRRYSFCTNFTLDAEPVINVACHLRKLQWLSISLYGTDHTSYAAVTGAGIHSYARLIRNLWILLGCESLPARVEIRFRTPKHARLETGDSDLRSLIRRLVDRGARLRFASGYMNWGGIIRPVDVEPVGISLKPQPLQKTAPCVFLLYKPTILPDGRVNACSQADAQLTMCIGDLTAQTFEDIYSRRNRAYRELLDAQTQGQFTGPCATCSGYRSIRDPYYAYQYHTRPFWSLARFYRWLESPDKTAPRGPDACGGHVLEER